MANRVVEVLNQLATCMCEQLHNDDETGDLCFCGVIAGDGPSDMTAFGDCDSKCGQAWVRMSGAYPASSPGNPLVLPNNAEGGVAVDIEMGVLRCYEIPDEGEALSSDQMLVMMAEQADDMLAMMRAAACCDLDGYMLTTWAPYGPEAGIHGGIWTLTIMLDS